MFRTIKFKSESEGRFRTVLIKPDEVPVLNFNLGSKRTLAAIVSVIISLSLLPISRGYSITSSAGTSKTYDIPGLPTRVSSLVPPLSTVGGGGTTGSANLMHVPVLSPSATVDTYTEHSHSAPPATRSVASETHHTIFSDLQFSQSQDNSSTQYTRTQLQVAGRILFESRVTTPKPILGYRAFPSSYRNPNYYVKNSKYSDSHYAPTRSKNIYGGTPQDGEEDEEEEEEEVEPFQFHASFLAANLTRKPLSGKTSKRPHPSTTPAGLTTLETKTAPATSVYAVSERPSSTQEMQSDGSPLPFNLTESESNNHHQLNNRDQQAITYVTDKRPVQIIPPALQNRTSTTTASATSLRSTDDNEKYSESGVTSLPLGPDESRGEKEEPIVFPTTTSSHRTYKIPSQGQGLDADELAGLKNILELRKGSEIGHSKEGSNTTGAPVEKFSPVPEGANDPVCARQLGYCDMENFKDSYPKELLNSVLTNSISSDLFKKVFGDAEENSESAGSPDNVVLAGRNSITVPTQETTLCASQEVTIYPRVARNKDDKWMFIVNHDDYIQGVKVEKCMNEGSSCLFSEGNPLGYESVCRQKFILRKLVALNGDGKTALDTFKLPSCCVCYIKSNYVANRIGLPTSSAPRTPVLSEKGSSAGGSASVGVESGEVNDRPTGCTALSSDPPKPNAPTSVSPSSTTPSSHHNSTRGTSRAEITADPL